MKCHVGVWMVCLLVVGFGGASPELRAAGLLRGPFLQIATPNSITLRWRTDVACESVVNYGTQTNLLTFSASDLDPATEHEVRLTGLTPATEYFYSIGSLSNTLAEGPDCHFITSPPTGQATPTRVWVIGDSGQGVDDGQIRVRNAYYHYAGPRHTDVWLALGDNTWTGFDSEYQTNFFDVYPEMLRQTAIWSTIGNHETLPVPPGERIPYLDIFSFPTNGEAGGIASGMEEYYSFNYANIHFICLDSATQSRATNGAMANWLRTDLDASTNQWVIAFWHHPPYTFGSHESDTETELVEMRQNIVPILEAHGVDLVLCGHSHVYERSYLLRGYYGDSTSLQPEMILDQGSGRENDTGAYIKPTSGPGANQGTVYVEAGCASVTYTLGGYHPAMFFTELQLGSLVLDINRNRLDAAFLRDSGAIDDRFTIIKGDPEPLRLCDITLKNGKVILRWKSTRGQGYRIERSEGGQMPSWQPASDPITAVGATTAWTNVLSPGPIHLYRVVEVSPPPTAKLTGDRPTHLESSGLDEQVRSSLTTLTERPPDQISMRPDQEKLRAAERVSEDVVGNTTYWTRRVKLQALHHRSRWRLASAPLKEI